MGNEFSRKEEAEAALKAPDAVMGNRFIKLWCANRDRIPDGDINSGSGVSVTSRGLTASVIPAQRKDYFQPIPLNSPKPHSMNGLMVPPAPRKKLETLEQMKEELRKKQELLEQKRKDFRRQLHKLEKQSSGVKGDTEQAAKRQKVDIAVDPAKASTPRSSGPCASAATPCTMGVTDMDKSTENILSHSPKSKRQSCQSAPVDVLKEHFSQYSDLFSVELEDVANEDVVMVSETLNDCSAHITYSTCRSAEKAYANSKCWQGHNLKFSWLTSSNSINDPISKETSSAPKEPLEADDIQTEEKLACSISQEVASDDGESENSDVKSFVEHKYLAEVSEHSPSPTSRVKE